MTRRVVVTGMGVVCGQAFDLDTFWAGLLGGRTHIQAWRDPWLADFPVRHAAPVDEAALSAVFAPRLGTHWQPPMERSARFALAAAWSALHDASLPPGESDTLPGGLGVALGIGSSERTFRDMLWSVGPSGPDWQCLMAAFEQLDPAGGLCHSRDELAARIARSLGLRGNVQTVNTACASAAHAIGLAWRAVRRGEADCMLAGGSDSPLNAGTMIALHLLGAPSVEQRLGDRLCRPFDVARSGLVAGEGAGMVLLEEESHARRRGARIHAEVVGFGCAMDAHHLTAPHPEAAGAVRAMRQALRDAGLPPTCIAHVNAHATSTVRNDPLEAQAIQTVFAQDGHWEKVCVTANKSMLGHLIAAAGAPEFIATALTVKTGDVPPTLNLDNVDPACALNHVRHTARREDVPFALCNSFGFGGLNACLVVRRHG